MMVIYVPVKFEFDWTNCSRVKSPETEILTDFELESGTEMLTERQTEKQTERITPISKET